MSLRDVGFKSVIELLGTYGGRGSDLRPWLKNAEINHDRDLRLQYLAGMAPNLYQEVAIFDDMQSYRKYPDDIFVVSDENKRALVLAMERPR